MAITLEDGEKAPLGKSIREMVGAVLETSKTHISKPATKAPTPMHLIKVVSLSSTNKVIEIGSQQVNFDGHGVALIDAKFRAEVEHHCNLRQGFFRIEEVTPQNDGVVAALHAADVNGVTAVELEMSDIVDVLAKIVRFMTEDERVEMITSYNEGELLTLLETVVDRMEQTEVDIKEEQIQTLLKQVSTPPLLDTLNAKSTAELGLVPGSTMVDQTNVEVSHDEEEDPMELIAKVEAGEVSIGEDGEVTKVEKRGRGRPPKTKAE